LKFISTINRRHARGKKLLQPLLQSFLLEIISLPNKGNKGRQGGVEIRRSNSAVDNFVQDELFDSTLADMFLLAPTKSPLKSNERRARRNSAPTRALELISGETIRIEKSKRRKRHIAAFREGGSIVISVPQRTTRAEIESLIPEMVAKVLKGEAKARRSDGELQIRAKELLAKYLPEFHERPSSIQWRNMSERWGSCTTVDRTIRISERLQGAPDYVLDYVLFHELIHLRTAGHGPDFHDLLGRFEASERAEAFLDGYELGRMAGESP
jgi:predicted metal-dependent hydrolase